MVRRYLSLSYWQRGLLPALRAASIAGSRPSARACSSRRREDEIRVGRQPLRRPRAAGRGHVLPQRHRTTRVEAGLGHQFLADDVGFQLLRTRVRRRARLREDPAALGHRAADTFAVTRAGDRAADLQHPGRERLAGDPLRRGGARPRGRSRARSPRPAGPGSWPP